MIKLHIGCGKRNFGKDWIHIDGGDYPHLHSHDITNLPFEEESVDLIYASHVLEYFNREEVVDVLKEWRRVLKPKGIIRLAVPDFEIITKLYTLYKYPLDAFLGPLYGSMKMASKTIYHKTTYDFEGLKRLLEEIGFHNIRRYDWRKTEHSQFDDHSQAYIPHMDKEKGILISLNIEAEK